MTSSPHRPVNDCELTFILNGETQRVPSSVTADTSLNTYIREHARLKGTKFMCREGGCGICVVTLEFTHPSTGLEKTVSVNSCMFPLYACHGSRVTTVEGIGSRKKGYHEVQSRLAHFYGTQCGYCTPGWVMAMYSLLQANPKATMKEIEDSFSGNLCRCTGYRPILDAFKSFASDRSKELEQKVADIEDLLKVCPRSGISCRGKCQEDKSKRAPFDCVEKNKTISLLGVGQANLVESDGFVLIDAFSTLRSLSVEFRGGSRWYTVTHVDEIFEIFGMISGSYMLVGGNTAQGVIKGLPPPEVFIDVNKVAFLKAHYVGDHLYIGANTTLSDAIALLRAVAQEDQACFGYTEQLARHIEKVANTHVRNVGTIAGNLSIKHKQRSFLSDIFLIFETVGALLSIRGDNESVRMMSLSEYLETDMYKKVILQVVLPPLETCSYVVKTFKIAPRAQNAICYVNGGFKIRVDKRDKCRVLERPTILFGGINPSFIHAWETESFLTGKHLLDSATLSKALDILGKEVRPDHKLPDATPEYRRRLAQSLFYRVILGMDPEKVPSKFRSGGENITRPLSSGKQEFDTDSSKPPLYQPFPKLESLIQCSGEAEYVYDIPLVGGDLYAALVITSHGPAQLKSLDPTEALKGVGVVAFFAAQDIPGENTFTPKNDLVSDNEELFASKDILYAGQPVGVLIAETQHLADKAAELVKINYEDKKKPVIDAREVVKNNDKSRIFLRAEEKATAPKADVTKVVKGEFKMDTQFHFTTENISCVTIPIEDGLDVYCTSQWLIAVQETIAILLNIPDNSINVKLRRVGGGFGQKLSRASIAAGACSLAAYLLQKPVRMVMKLETVMEAIGKRWPCYFNYEAGVNDEGDIQYVNTNMYNDAGCAFNDPVYPYALPSHSNVYDSTTRSIKFFDVNTDKACTAWTRAPGTLEALTMAEQIMEHIAHEVNKDPLAVRMRNVDNQYPVEDMVNKLKEKSDYDIRKTTVEQFNKENLWKKRGISLVPIRFPMDVLERHYAMISVYRRDGTVALVHGGVEVGQGINTKAAQACASILGIPLDFVSVKPTNNLTCPNNGVTGGSFTSESVCYAVEQCCIELNKRLEPTRKKLDKYSWPDLIQAAYQDQINLNVSYMFSSKADPVNYQIFGAIVLEVEIDILTGETKVRGDWQDIRSVSYGQLPKVIRVDILEDAGKSLNPFVDLGQIEGAFIMGLGYFTSEEQVQDPDTGKVLTNRTLKYKIPGAKDIPVDFRCYILKNGDNPLGILRSKSVGEPPLCLSIAVMFAIRQALRSARQDFGLPDEWFQMDAPFTVEKICLSSGIDADKYTL